MNDLREQHLMPFWTGAYWCQDEMDEFERSMIRSAGAKVLRWQEGWRL
jgi:hypothetical protein